MSPTLARRGGQVQLEQSDMRLTLNMANMAKEGFSRTASQEMQQLIKKRRTQIRDEMQRGVVFPGHNKAKAAMERHPAMVRENQTEGCLPFQNGTAKNPQTCWGTKAWVHLNYDRRHWGPECHLHHLINVR